MATRSAHCGQRNLFSRISGQALLWASTVSFQLDFPSPTHGKGNGGSCGRNQSSNLKSQDLGSSPTSSPSWTGAHTISSQALRLRHLELCPVQLRASVAGAGCHPTEGFRVPCFPPVYVESLTLRSRTQSFWVCQSPAALGPLDPSAVFVWKLFYSQVSGGAWEPLISMFTHILLFTHTALMGLAESQDLSLCRRSSSFPSEKQCLSSLGSSGTILSLQTEGENSQAEWETRMLGSCGNQGAWATADLWSSL